MFSEEGAVLTSRFATSKDQIQEGEELDFPQYIVLLEEREKNQELPTTEKKEENVIEKIPKRLSLPWKPVTKKKSILRKGEERNVQVDQFDKEELEAQNSRRTKRTS